MATHAPPTAPGIRRVDALFDADTSAAAEAMRAVNWAESTLGPPRSWPLVLRNMVRMMLRSRQPMALYWGTQLHQFYNDAALPIFGDKHPSAMGAPAAECWAEAWEVIAPPLMRVIERGEPFIAEEQLIPIIRGEALEDAWWTYSYSPVFDEAEIVGSLTIVTETTKEVTGRRALALQLAETAKAQEAAEAASHAKDQFLATLSHELRTPLMAILGWAKLLRQEGDPARMSKGLSVIERNAQAQATLLEDIMDVSRAVLGKLSLRTAELDLSAVVVGAVESLRPNSSLKGVALEVAAPDAALRLVGDVDRLQQIVWNLVSNAIKFTPAGGRIVVQVWRDGRHARIRVADTGCGISPTFLPSAFEAFRQADASTSRAQGGLGLGLSIVRRLAELHGGTVDATSEGEGRGAVFEVCLPTGLATTQEGAPAQPQLRPSLHGRYILVVDDDPDARELMDFVLTRAGARVRLAATVVEALAMIAEDEFAALVSDIGMPVRDGHSLMRSVRSLESPERRALPALAVTAYAHPADHERVLQSGFDAFLTKPADPDAVVHALASLLLHR